VIFDRYGGSRAEFVIASEAKQSMERQSNPWSGKASLDCFVASLLAMTTDTVQTG
jgi:hypothetical protein